LFFVFVLHLGLFFDPPGGAPVGFFRFSRVLVPFFSFPRLRVQVSSFEFPPFYGSLVYPRFKVPGSATLDGTFFSFSAQFALNFLQSSSAKQFITRCDVGFPSFPQYNYNPTPLFETQFFPRREICFPFFFFSIFVVFAGLLFSRSMKLPFFFPRAFLISKVSFLFTSRILAPRRCPPGF